MKTIAIMRPAAYIEESIKLARSMEFRTIAVPLIDVVDRTDANFSGFVKRVMEGEVDYVIFTSANGVEFTLLKLDDPEEFIKQLNKTEVAAIGPRTGKALQNNGINVSIVPELYSSEGLVNSLTNVAGKVIEIARSTHGAPGLVKGLVEKGAIVHETQVYQLISPRDERHTRLIQQALAEKIDIFAFTSSMMVKNFIKLADDMGVREELIGIMNKKIVAAIGKPTSVTLSGFGIDVKVMPQHYTFEELLIKCRDFQ
ncbi:MAG TPA: uroporphyrinogen-III synthase, partial [Candidatus Methanoperedens sp.]